MDQLEKVAKSCETTGCKVVAVSGDVSIEQDVIELYLKELRNSDTLMF